ncbi:hypothetical protein SynPROSU1_02429 [Synechococcus sp. PROS-U-1]|nr:hypothetical protein SynPROSU1_02429 [Synechococcus sp. PROS-U-1]
MGTLRQSEKITRLITKTTEHQTKSPPETSQRKTQKKIAPKTQNYPYI